MITDHDIARWRLMAQHAAAPHAPDSLTAVRHLLAVQAENPRQSEWAVASRTVSPSEAEVGALLDDGAILRTHVLRPTWFDVAAEDLGWLLELTSSRAGAPIRQQLVGDHGIDAGAYDRATAVVVDLLEREPDRLRREVAEVMEAAGLSLAGNMVAHLLGQLEMDRLIVSGRPRDGQHTYATFSSRVPSAPRRDRDEALTELAVRYVTGHGPATERDLSYWATLTVSDARRAFDLARDQLASFDHDGRRFWHAPGDPPAGPLEPAGHLLQVLDELYRGFQDSRWLIDAAGIVPRGRERAIGMALVDGQLKAAMKRTVAADHVRFDLVPHVALSATDRDAIEAAARRYGAYLGLPPRVTVA